MDNLIYTISINTEDTDIDSSGFDIQLKNALISSSSILFDNPLNMGDVFKTLNIYSESIYPLSLAIQKYFNVSLNTVNVATSNKKTTVALDMDGNTVFSDTNAYGAENKNEVKSILGSVEKISKNDVLIADSKNKRVIIVDVIKNRIKWEYISDRYVYDVHLFPRDNDITTISTDEFILSSSDYFLITEGDSFESPFTSKIRKIDMFGNTIWDFGDNVSKPRDARPLTNNKVIISV